MEGGCAVTWCVFELFLQGGRVNGTWLMLRPVNGALVNLSQAVKWGNAEDKMCKLCATEIGTAQHILSGRRLALEQGRYTWRYDQVLNQIQGQVAYHL